MIALVRVLIKVILTKIKLCVMPPNQSRCLVTALLVPLCQSYELIRATPINSSERNRMIKNESTCYLQNIILQKRRERFFPPHMQEVQEF